MNTFFRKPAGRHLALLPATPQKVLLAQPTLADLQQRFPKKPLDVMAPSSLAALVARFPQVETVYNLPDPQMSWKTFWRAGLTMQGKDYAHAWVLPDRFKPALIPMLANIGERTGYRGRYRYSLLIDIRLPNPRRHPHPVDRYRALAWDIVDELPPAQPLQLRSSEAQQKAVNEALQLHLREPVLLFCPGRLSATAGHQQPEAEQWSPLLETWVAGGGQVWLLASRSEQLEVDTLLPKLPAAVQAKLTNLAGKITWEDAVDLAHQAEAAIALDNALALLALGAGLPVFLPVLTTDLTADAADDPAWLAQPLGAQVLAVEAVASRLSALLP